MKKFIFEITLYESDLDGDEIWENILKNDNSGIKGLTEWLYSIIEDSNLINSRKKPKDIIKLIKYEENANT